MVYKERRIDQSGFHSDAKIQRRETAKEKHEMQFTAREV